MSNEFYNHSSYPTQGSVASSSSMRAELDAIAAGFDKLPPLTGNGGKTLKINASGTGVEAITVDTVTPSGTQTLTNKTVNLTSNTLSGTKAQFDTALSDDNFAYVGQANTFTANQTLTVNSASDALKITQTGSGNALVVEDASSDTTPFVINNSGQVVMGASTSPTINGFQRMFYMGGGAYDMVLQRTTADASGQFLFIAKSRATAPNSRAIVSNGDAIGQIQFLADDGTSDIAAAQIQAVVDGTPGTNDMPGRLVFSTTADGSGTPTERMRIDSSGNVGVGTSAAAGNKLHIGGSYSGATATRSIVIGGVIDPAVSTVNHIGTYIVPSVAAGTLPALYSNYVGQGTFTGTVTTHYGYIADNLTGATNNYGFYGNIPAGTGRYNFYAAGTADNYFAGNVGIGATSDPGVVLSVRGAQRNHRHSSNDAAPVYHANVKSRGTYGAQLTVNNGDSLVAYQAYGYDGSGERQSSVIVMQVDGAPATSTVPGRIIFSTAPSGTSQVPLERMRIDSSGNVGIGSTPKTRLQVTAAANLNAPVLGSATNAPFYVTNSDSSYGLLVGTNAADGSAWMQVQRTDGTATAYDLRLQPVGGNTLHVGSNGSLGYGTGAGGTVTQTGSRTTGVTLSKPTGAITLVSAAGSTAWQSFTVTNTVVAADDVIKVCQKSGTDKYMIHVTNVAAGSFQITFATTGGTTTEQPVFSFAIIKGATA